MKDSLPYNNFKAVTFVSSDVRADIFGSNAY